MKPKIQVKGTLPLVADYLGIEEQRVYSIFNLDLKEETKEDNRKQKGEKKNETANKGKSISTSESSI